MYIPLLYSCLTMQMYDIFCGKSIFLEIFLHYLCEEQIAAKNDPAKRKILRTPTSANIKPAYFHHPIFARSPQGF